MVLARGPRGRGDGNATVAGGGGDVAAPGKHSLVEPGEEASEATDPAAHAAHAAHAAQPEHAEHVAPADRAEAAASKPVPTLTLGRGSGAGGARTGAGARAGAGAGAGTGARAGVGGGAAAATNGITIRTLHTARDEPSRTRTKVGVGETVTFSVAGRGGAWTASSAVASESKVEGNRSTFTWRASAEPGSVTITHQPEGGGAARTVTMNVVAPDSVDFNLAEERGQAPAGAGMLSYVEIGPNDVSFAGASWKEDEGAGALPKQVRGYFERYQQMGGDLFHHPRKEWLLMDSRLKDEAAISGLPPIAGGWSEGSFQWDIPNLYTVGGTGEGKRFATTTQAFTIKQNGEVTVTKGRETVRQMPGPAGSVAGSTPEQLADFRKIIDDEGIELLIQRMRSAPDSDTRQYIADAIRRREPAPTLRVTVKCTNSYSYFTKDAVSVTVNGHATARGALAIDTNGEEATTIRFIDAFSLDSLRGAGLMPPATVGIVAEGHRLEATLDRVFVNSEYAVVPGSDNRYHVKHEMLNAGSRVASPVAPPVAPPTAPPDGAAPRR